MWQDAGVILIVGGAVYYLYRKLFGRPSKKTAPTSFVPLSQVKKRR